MTEVSALQNLRERRRAERENGPSKPDARAVIVEATGRLLVETPLYKLTIDQILGEAQISRATFYAYFSSKNEVVAALLDEAMQDMYLTLDPLTRSDAEMAPGDAIGAVLEGAVALWKAKRPVFCATHDNWHSVPELREKWLEVVEKFTDALTDVLLPPGTKASRRARATARQRCAALLWASEHLLYVAGTGVDADLPVEDDILPTLAVMWEGTLFAPLVPETGS